MNSKKNNINLSIVLREPKNGLSFILTDLLPFFLL